MDFQNVLRSDPNGQRATLLVAIGGGVDQTVSIRQVFSRQVAVELWTAQQVAVNQTLLDNVVTNLFADVSEGDSLAKQPNEAVVTFLTSNGLKATTSIGIFTGLSDQWKKERDNLLKTANSGKTLDKTRRAGEVEASAFEVFSASAKFEGEDEHGREWSDSFENQVRAVDEVMKAIEGELPVAVLNADQVQEIASRANSVTSIKVGTFITGQKTLQHLYSLADFLAANVVAPKTEDELRREAYKQLEEEIVAVQKKLADAEGARDTIAADNKPHEEELAKLQKRVASKRIAVQRTKELLERKSRDVEEVIKHPELGPAPAPNAPNLSPDQMRYMLSNHYGIPKLQAELAQMQRDLPGWEEQLATSEKNLQSMQAKLTEAEKNIADYKHRLSELEAERAALKRLMNAGQP